MAVIRSVVLGAMMVGSMMSGAGSNSVMEKKRGQKKDGISWRMAHHSFEGTLNYDNGLADWLSSAGTMALRDKVQLLPPVPQRFGLFWNKKAVKTRNFEVTVTMDIKMQEQANGFIAFWLTNENFSSTYNEQVIVQTSRNWTAGMEKLGLNVLGNRPNFKGLLSLFTTVDQKQKVVSLFSDGSHELTTPASMSDQLFQKATTMQGTDVDWKKTATTVRFRVSPDGTLTASLENEGNNKQLFAFPFNTLPKEWTECYFGFSGFSGDKYMTVDLTKVEVQNFDAKTAGEDESDVLEGDTAEWMKVLEAEKKYVSQRSQTEALQHIFKLFKDHVVKYDEGGVKLKDTLLRAEERLDRLGYDISRTLSEAQAWSLEKQDFNAQVVKDHIVGILAILSKDKDIHDSKLSSVHQQAKEIKEKTTNNVNRDKKEKVASVQEQSKALETFAARGSTQANSLLLIMVVAVAGLGLLFLNRMRYYEKKHYI